MSLSLVRAALETALNAILPALATAWQNVKYDPVPGTPYQAVYLLPAEPENPTMGDTFHRERGIFQVSLFYPLLAGPGAAETRAELIRTAFYRGASFTSGTVTVRIDRTPEVGQGRADEDRWHVPVKIRYFAEIHA